MPPPVSEATLLPILTFQLLDESEDEEESEEDALDDSDFVQATLTPGGSVARRLAHVSKRLACAVVAQRHALGCRCLLFVAEDSVMLRLFFPMLQACWRRIGVGSELPAHGCVEEPHAVLIKVTSKEDGAQSACSSPQSGRVVSPKIPNSARADTPNVDANKMVWEIAAKSVDKSLAQAAVAAVVTQLKCLPGESLATSSSPGQQAGVHQQAGG